MIKLKIKYGNSQTDLRFPCTETAIPQERRQEQFAVSAESGIKKTACRRSAFNHGCNDSFKAVLFYIPKHIE